MLQEMICQPAVKQFQIFPSITTQAISCNRHFFISPVMIEAFCIKYDKQRDCLTSCINKPNNSNLLLVPRDSIATFFMASSCNYSL